MIVDLYTANTIHTNETITGFLTYFNEQNQSSYHILAEGRVPHAHFTNEIDVKTLVKTKTHEIIIPE